MKTILATLLCLSLVSVTDAANKAQLDGRIRLLTAKFSALQQQPDRRIPPEVLRKARGIVLLDRTKAGFIFAFEGGSGVALVRDPKRGRWSPAAFVTASEASLGFQVGGQHTFMVVLLMNSQAARALTEADFRFGGEARGTAGNSSSGVGKDFSSPEASVLVYTDTQGLYGGAAVKGDMISADNQANQVYYGRYLTMQDILFDHKVKSSRSMSQLTAKLTAYAKGARYSENDGK